MHKLYLLVRICIICTYKSEFAQLFMKVPGNYTHNTPNIWNTIYVNFEHLRGAVSFWSLEPFSLSIHPAANLSPTSCQMWHRSIANRRTGLIFPYWNCAESTHVGLRAELTHVGPRAELTHVVLRAELTHVGPRAELTYVLLTWRCFNVLDPVLDGHTFPSWNIY